MIAPRKIKFEAKKNENYEFRIFLKGNADARELDEKFHIRDILLKKYSMNTKLACGYDKIMIKLR